MISGELLLVVGYFNKDMAQHSIKRQMQELGLVDTLTSLLGQLTQPMHNRGTSPIDAMYASPVLLQGTKGGYLDFEDGLLSDHHGIWLDLCKDVLWGSVECYCMGSNAR